jgi:hypothetical protein
LLQGKILPSIEQIQQQETQTSQTKQPKKKENRKTRNSTPTKGKAKEGGDGQCVERWTSG